MLHSRLSLGNARERCISGRIKGCRQTATKDPRLHAVIFYCTVALYISIHGKYMSHFATLLVSVEFNNQLFYTKIKPPPTRRYTKLRKISYCLLWTRWKFGRRHVNVRHHKKGCLGGKHTQQKHFLSSSPLYGTTATAAMTVHPGTAVLLTLM